MFWEVFGSNLRVFRLSKPGFMMILVHSIEYTKGFHEIYGDLNRELDCQNGFWEVLIGKYTTE